MTYPAEIYVYDGAGKWVSVSPHGNGTGGGSSFTLTPATASILGGVKIGSNVSVAGDGTISVDKFSGQYTDLSGAPALSLVATTGSYTDLTGKPTKVSQFTNDSGYINLAQVPAAPVSSVNGKTGSITLGAADVGALPDTTSIPSKTSDLTNDSGFINLSQASAAAPIQSLTAGNNIALTDDGHGHIKIAAISTGSGGHSGVTSVSGTAPIVVEHGLDTPKISLNVGDGLEVTAKKLTLNVASIGLKSVATSGDYNDLINKPSIPPAQVQSDWALSDTSLPAFIKSKPTKLSEFTNDPGYINLAQVPAAPVASVNSKTGAVVLTATDVGALPSTTTIPTHTSNLTNDSKFITAADIPTKVSAFTNDAGYITVAGVPAAPVTSVNSKTGVVVLNAADVGALPDSTAIPTHTSDLTNNSGFINLAQVPVQSIKAGSNVTVSDNGAGTFTINAQGGGYKLPPASRTALGGVKVGDGLNVASDGNISLGDLYLPIKSHDDSVVLQDHNKQLEVQTKGVTRLKARDGGVTVFGDIKAGKGVIGSSAGDGLPSILIGNGPAYDPGGGVHSVIQSAKSLKGHVNTVTGFLNQVGFVNCQVVEYRGIVQSNPEAAFFGTTQVQIYEGFHISAMPASLDAKVLSACSIAVAMNDSATSQRWNIKATGSAPNMLAGNTVIGSSIKPKVALEVHPQRGLALKTSYAPTSDNANGVRGEIAWDSQFIYLCINDNQWRRVKLENFDGTPSTPVIVRGSLTGTHH